MRVMITGGAGYVGTVLVESMMYEYEVVVYDNLLYGGAGLLHYVSDPGIEFVHGDILDSQKMRAASRGCDVIIHLAAIVGYPACNNMGPLADRINIDGTNNVLDLGIPTIFGSTQSVYGKQDGLVTEETTPFPQTSYARSKFLAERAVLTGNGLVLRFPTLFGPSPRMRWDLIVNDFVYQAAMDHVLVVYQPEASRPILHVQDAAYFYMAALRGELGPGLHNIGNKDLVYTKGEIAEAVQKELGCEVIYREFDTDKDARDYRIEFSDRLPRPLLGLQEGIEALVKAVKLTERTWRNA